MIGIVFYQEIGISLAVMGSVVFLTLNVLTVVACTIFQQESEHIRTDKAGGIAYRPGRKFTILILSVELPYGF